jgi:hypothetical protein
LTLTLIVWRGRPRPLGGLINGRTLAGESPAAVRFYKLTQHRAPRFQVVFQPQHGQSNLPRFRPRESDDPNAAATRGGGNSDDGVVEVHREIVAGAAASNGGQVIRHLGAAGNFPIAAINKEIIESRTEWEQEIQRYKPNRLFQPAGIVKSQPEVPHCDGKQSSAKESGPKKKTHDETSGRDSFGGSLTRGPECRDASDEHPKKDKAASAHTK